MYTEFTNQYQPCGESFAIAVSRYNRVITDSLLQGAVQALRNAGIDGSDIHVAPVPGAWELPLATKWLLQQERFAAVISLGVVVRGETTHDQHINRSVSHELARLSLEYSTPVAFGLLTCENFAQAEDRAGGKIGNKGVEAALAALQMVGLKRNIFDLSRQAT
ncbi:MAG TPA: 6,7-dimethyl-8-ribityllumazine synthase [Pirellulaceae bacterium]|nr:6,7-dimethyl-8-ribityllumazine synthase [Pirellulaceae bacterium]HMO92344.1 6,7-dimethyl-8-ribityllumazine synthase [Pirellulaceae bacterium]HMP69268.1 6,7-dimethyl-8-ribityllumazine synthase [Pirellulaceae bacterium]